MLDDHQKDVADFEKAAKSAKDADVKDFAARTLPTLQSHLQLAQSTYDAVK
jgi:putative membrane protein